MNNIIILDENDTIDIMETDFYREMNKNRAGNFLAGARLKKELTQKKLSEIVNVSVNKLSAFENGKKNIPKSIAIKLSKLLEIKEELLTNQS